MRHNLSLIMMLCLPFVLAGCSPLQYSRANLEDSNSVAISGYVSTRGRGAILFETADLDHVLDEYKAIPAYETCHDLALDDANLAAIRKLEGRKIDVLASPHPFPKITSGMNGDGSLWSYKGRIEGYPVNVPRCGKRDTIYWVLKFKLANLDSNSE